MSINAMTNAAIARRTDFVPVGTYLRTASKMGAGGSGLGAREPSFHPLGRSSSFMMTGSKMRLPPVFHP